MIKNNWIVPGLISLGVALIVFSTWAPQKKFQFEFTEKKLATVVEISGTVKVQNSQMPVSSILKIQDKLENRDILRTESDSEVLVEFKNGGQFRLAEKSEVLVDRLDNQIPLVVIRTGDLFIEKIWQGSYLLGAQRWTNLYGD